MSLHLQIFPFLPIVLSLPIVGKTFRHLIRPLIAILSVFLRTYTSSFHLWKIIFANNFLNIFADPVRNNFYFVIYDLPCPHYVMKVSSSWTSLSLVDSWSEIGVFFLFNWTFFFLFGRLIPLCKYFISASVILSFYAYFFIHRLSILVVEYPAHFPVFCLDFVTVDWFRVCLSLFLKR